MKALVITLSLFTAVANARGSVGPSPGEKAFQEGSKHYDTGAYDKAEKAFKSALARDSKFDRARFQLAATYLAERKMDKALAELGKIQTDEKVKSIVPLMQGDIYLRQSKWAEALAAWEKVPSTNPDLKSMRAQGFARAYEGLNKPKEAADAWTDHLLREVKPSNETMGRLALNRIKADQQEEGLSFCNKSELFKKEEAYRDICKAHVYTAAFKVKGDKKAKEKAIDSLENALSKDKNNFDAQQLMAEFKQ